MAGFWDTWRAARGMSQAAESTATQDADTMRLFTGLTKELARWSQSKEKTLSSERIASLRAGVSQANASKKLIGTFEGARAKENVARIGAITKMETELIGSWTAYSKSMAATYSPILLKMDAAGDNVTAWNSFIGSLLDDPARYDTQNPAFANTFFTANQKFGKFVLMDDKGDVLMDSSGKARLSPAAIAGLTSARQTMLQENARQYQIARNGKLQWEQQLTRARGELAVAKKALETNKDSKSRESQEAYGRAVAAAQTIDNASKVAFSIDPKRAGEKIQSLKAEDDEYQDLKTVWKQIAASLQMDTGTTDPDKMMAKIVNDTQFQQWAADQGMNIGYVDEEGDYVAGPDDRRMLLRHSREAKKAPGKYALLTNPMTDELVQITDKEGNVVGRGFRMAAHASDRRGEVRVATRAGAKLFRPAEIGQVQVLSKPGEYEPVRGVSAAGEQAHSIMAEMGETRMLGATKQAAQLADGKYALRQDGLGDERYLDQESYDKAVAEAKESAVTQVEYEGSKYVVADNKAYSLEKDTETGRLMLTEVVEYVDLAAILEQPPNRYFASGKDLLTISDMKLDGDKKYIDVKGIKPVAPDDLAPLLQRAAGIVSTDTPRDLIRGKERDVGGATFVDVSGIPTQAYQVKPKPARADPKPPAAATVGTTEFEAEEVLDEPQEDFTEPDKNQEYDEQKAEYLQAYTMFRAHKNAGKPMGDEAATQWVEKLNALRKDKFTEEKELQGLYKKHNKEADPRLYLDFIQRQAAPVAKPPEESKSAAIKQRPEDQPDIVGTLPMTIDPVGAAVGALTADASEPKPDKPAGGLTDVDVTPQNKRDKYPKGAIGNIMHALGLPAGKTRESSTKLKSRLPDDTISFEGGLGVSPDMLRRGAAAEAKTPLGSEGSAPGEIAAANKDQSSGAVQRAAAAAMLKKQTDKQKKEAESAANGAE